MHKLVSIALLVSLCIANTLMAATKGSVSFTVKTIATNEKYKPFNVMAIWVTDSKGEFVKTLAYHAKKRKKYLKVWKKSSDKNITDAVTSATLSTHESRTVKWNCTDAKGYLVPDGEYQIHVEFSNANKAGPVTPDGHIKFTKGPKAVMLEPAKLPHFEGMKLQYTPSK